MATMKHFAGWGSALLAALVHLHLLQVGGAVSSLRKQPPVAAAVAQLRQVIHSRDEELANQKNIAHGLQLEVRELQSELRAEKKAVAVETQKEHTLSQKLKRVRAVLNDGDSPSASPSDSSKVAKADNGPSSAHASSAFSASISDVDAPTMESIPYLGQLTPLQSLGEVVEPLPNVLGDSDLEPAEELALQKAPAAPQQPPQQPHQLPPQQPLLRESLPAAHARQTTPQEPPPFFEAAALQAATATKTVKQVKKKSAQRKKAVAAHKKPTVVPQRLPPTPKVASPPRKAIQPVVLRRPSPAATQPAAIKLATAKPAVMAPLPSSSEVDAAATKDSNAAVAQTGSGSEFDTLEAQLHDEDRRIQDLDRENTLEAMTDGAPPPATGSPSPTANGAKALTAQPKLELDADAPMEDFLTVEAPGSESAGEAEAAPAPADKDLALAQVTESTANGLESALSDTEFLAQIAPAPRRA